MKNLRLFPNPQPNDRYLWCVSTDLVIMGCRSITKVLPISGLQPSWFFAKIIQEVRPQLILPPLPHHPSFISHRTKGRSSGNLAPSHWWALLSLGSFWAPLGLSCFYSVLQESQLSPQLKWITNIALPWGSAYLLCIPLTQYIPTHPPKSYTHTHIHIFQFNEQVCFKPLKCVRVLFITFYIWGLFIHCF